MVEDQANPRGRPSKYSPELQARADEYLESWKDEGDVVPSNAGLADYLGLCESTVQNWANDEDKPNFLVTLGAIKTRQHRVALNNGLKGDFNSAITKLLLHNHHGYTDKTQGELSGRDGNPIEVDHEFRITVVEP